MPTDRPLTHLDAPAVPAPDPDAEPAGFMVDTATERLHFLDWGRPDEPVGARRGLLLLHGIGQTSWSWTPVARRLCQVTHVVAADLRGHGLSDAPTHGYEPRQLAADAMAVLEGSGLLNGNGPWPVVAGHGFGACVAAWTARELGSRCGGLALVDGGVEDLAESTGASPEEWLAGIGDPPEVMRSMVSFLADRRAYDPPTWDADQERAARATVVQVPAGHVVPAVHPHALAGTVRALFAYRPREVLAALDVPLVAIVAGPDSPERGEALAELQLARDRAGLARLSVVRLPVAGHNLMRYRPNEVAAALLGLLGTAARRDRR